MTDLSWFKPKAQVELEKEISAKRKLEKELQRKLDSTDHKVFPDYDPKEGENIQAIKASRAEWREEIRELQDWLDANAPDTTPNMR